MSEILTREELERLILDNCDSAGCCTNSGGGVNYGPCTRCAVLLAHDAALRARVAKLERVIEWALGERGDFPSLPDDWPKRKFYWRTELRERAFGKSKAKVSG